MQEDEKLTEELHQQQQTESQLIPTPKIPAQEEQQLPRAVPPTHEDAQKWFYKDPQNQVQGKQNTLRQRNMFRENNLFSNFSEAVWFASTPALCFLYKSWLCQPGVP